MFVFEHKFKTSHALAGTVVTGLVRAKQMPRAKQARRVQVANRLRLPVAVNLLGITSYVLRVAFGYTCYAQGNTSKTFALHVGRKWSSTFALQASRTI